jgi:hypothetical protein
MQTLLAVTSLAVLGAAPAAEAKKKKKKKKKAASLKLNRFGCVNVGGRCQGKDSNCCSGICDGEKPKKGEKDESRCKAHGQSTCESGDNEVFCGAPDDIECTTSEGETGFCNTTTGKAGYCNFSSLCASCKTDKDCEDEGFGDGAACVVCAECEDTDGTACAQERDIL